MDTTELIQQCPVCNTSFTPIRHNQRFCPPTAKDRATVGPNTQARSRCAKACAQCGEHCIPGEDGIAPQATKFCGYDCKAAWHAENSEAWSYGDEAKRQYAKASNDHRAHDRAVENLLNPSTWTVDKAEWRRVIRSDPCCYCGKPSEASDHIIPKAEGGEDDWSNRAGVCHQCNSIKGQLPMLSALLFIPPTKEYHRLRRTLYAA